MRKRMHGQLKRSRDVWVQPDEVQGIEQFRVLAMERWAMSGKVPPRHEFWQLEPQTVEWALRRMGIWAIGVQLKAMKHAMAEGASHEQMQLAGMVSRDVLNRLLGKPTEHHAHVGHVLIEFGGLDPDKLPDARPEDGSEVVEVEPVEADDGEA